MASFSQKFLTLKMKINLTENIIKSTRGKDKIAYEGFFYNFTHIEIGKKFWRCNKRGCTSILKTNMLNELVDLPVHKHLRDETKYFKTLLKQKMKYRALSSEESNRNVVLNVLKENLDSKIPLNLKDCNDFVHKERKNHNFTVLEGYDIPPELQVTVENKKFLFYDSGIKDENRVLIFTTEENIRYIEHSTILLCDGTFKTCPTSFDQLFTIQCKLRDMFLPLMFCFMKNRQDVCYDKIFSFLETKNPNITSSRKSIIIDFELASYNVLQRYFKNSNIYGCNFHLGQIVWRRIQLLKFSKSVIDIPRIRLLVKMVLSLSFVPPHDVPIVAARLKLFIIQEKSEDVLSLFEWFQSEYLENNTGNKLIAFWNVYERTKSNIPRTTNSLEGYHRHLNTFINVKQTSIIPILNELKNEQFVVENKIFMSLVKESATPEDPVKALIENYKETESIDYLKKIALNFNWKLD